MWEILGELRKKHMQYTKYVKIKIISSRKTRNLLHISGVNHHPQGDVWKKMQNEYIYFTCTMLKYIKYELEI